MNESLIKKIDELKKKKKAIILVHNYQLPEVQDIADFTGDSLELSRKASKTDSEIIVFCGVYFMAETASILSPQKTVLMPDINSGCPMADMINAEQLRNLKKEHPGALVVAYVNTSAEVKAESDICCTSANTVKVINTIDKNKEIIFIPDKYLGQYAVSKTARRMYLWNGYCPTHVKILPEDIKKKRKLYPGAKVLVHPECTPEVIAVADEALSTSGILRYAKESPAGEMIIGTEIGIIYRLKKDNPSKKFYPASELAVCPNMKRTTLEKVITVLEELKNEVRVPKNIQEKAIKPIEKMLSLV